MLALRTDLTPLLIEQGISLVVEAGHNNNAEIEHWFDRFKNHDVFNGSLRSLTFADKVDGPRALHLADLYAFYCRRFSAMSDRFDNKLAFFEDQLFARFRSVCPHHAITLTNAGEANGPFRRLTEAQEAVSARLEGLRPWLDRTLGR